MNELTKEIEEKYLALKKQLNKIPTREDMRVAGVSKRSIKNLYSTYLNFLDKMGDGKSTLSNLKHGNCKLCNKVFELPKGNKGKQYCSRSCVNKDLRTKHGSYSRTVLDTGSLGVKSNCLFCKSEIITKHRVRKFCGSLCHTSYKYGKQTLGEVRVKECKSRATIYSYIRSRARNVLKFYTAKVCMHCGYDKHVEACHIKPISEFKDSDLVSTINSLDNLLYLCPNCHWEFDNNKLSEEFLDKVQSHYKTLGGVRNGRSILKTT